MNDSFKRFGLGAHIAVLSLLPASVSAQVLLIPPASAVPTNGQRWIADPIWRFCDMPPFGQYVPLWGMPLARSGRTNPAKPPIAPEGLTILNRGISTSSSLGLMSGSGNGNGNGNGNLGSNNGNGNQTNGNGNFGVGDGVGNRATPLSQE